MPRVTSRTAVPFRLRIQILDQVIPAKFLRSGSLNQRENLFCSSKGSGEVVSSHQKADSLFFIWSDQNPSAFPSSVALSSANLKSFPEEQPQIFFFLQILTNSLSNNSAESDSAHKLHCTQLTDVFFPQREEVGKPAQEGRTESGKKTVDVLDLMVFSWRIQDQKSVSSDKLREWESPALCKSRQTSFSCQHKFQPPEHSFSQATAGTSRQP